MKGRKKVRKKVGENERKIYLRRSKKRQRKRERQKKKKNKMKKNKKNKKRKKNDSVQVSFYKSGISLEYDLVSGYCRLRKTARRIGDVGKGTLNDRYWISKSRMSMKLDAYQQRVESRFKFSQSAAQ